MDEFPDAGASDVKLDLSRLKGETNGGDTRYSVGIEGSLRPEWLETYRQFQAGAPGLRRFEVDAPSATVRFTCRNVDGTGVVFEALERLEFLITRVNQVAWVRRAAGPRIRMPTSLRAR